MPAFELAGLPIAVEFQPGLRTSRGQLLSGGGRGTEVHAGSFLLERRIVLDSALCRDAAERDRILLHEIFHFVWWKLGRPKRSAYEALIQTELTTGVRGEMGWSAESRKQGLTPSDCLQRTRRYGEYLCESFCDTAPVHLLSLDKHREVTLSLRARKRRLSWMEEMLGQGRLKV